MLSRKRKYLMFFPIFSLHVYFTVCVLHTFLWH